MMSDKFFSFAIICLLVLIFFGGMWMYGVDIAGTIVAAAFFLGLAAVLIGLILHIIEKKKKPKK